MGLVLFSDRDRRGRRRWVVGLLFGLTGLTLFGRTGLSGLSAHWSFWSYWSIGALVLLCLGRLVLLVYRRTGLTLFG